MDQNNVHLTWWHKDAQPGASTVFQPEMQGLAFNVNFMAGDNLMWFLRGGQSEGWVTERSLAAGFGYRPERASGDLFGLGLAWNDPSNQVLRDQTTLETFYRFMVMPNLAITPDLQLVMNPTLNPSVDTQVILGLRARVTF